MLPILLDFDALETGPSGLVMEELLSDGRANFLFVGRVYPNKRFEDLARLAFFYKKYVSEDFRFVLVGKAGGWSTTSSRFRPWPIAGACGLRSSCSRGIFPGTTCSRAIAAPTSSSA